MTRVWVTGDNSPGYLPEAEPMQHDDWQQGWDHLNAMIGEAFLDGSPYVEEGCAAEELARYSAACASLNSSKIDQPVSVFFAGRVWWLADVPVEDLLPRLEERA